MLDEQTSLYMKVGDNAELTLDDTKIIFVKIDAKLKIFYYFCRSIRFL